MTDYEWLDEMNLCHKCRRNKPAPNRKFCFDCLDETRAYNAKRYNSEKAHEYQKRRREIYQQKKEAGICVRCKKKATHGMHCYEHSIKAKRNSQKMAEKRKKERHARGLIPDYRKNNGLCLFCGEKIEQDNIKRGFLVCQRHRDLASENSKKATNNPIRIVNEADHKLRKERESERKREDKRI